LCEAGPVPGTRGQGFYLVSSLKQLELVELQYSPIMLMMMRKQNFPHTLTPHPSPHENFNSLELVGIQYSANLALYIDEYNNRVIKKAAMTGCTEWPYLPLNMNNLVAYMYISILFIKMLNMTIFDAKY
jgi:hypothetical protein